MPEKEERMFIHGCWATELVSVRLRFQEKGIKYELFCKALCHIEERLKNKTETEEDVLICDV